MTEAERLLAEARRRDLELDPFSGLSDDQRSALDGFITGRVAAYKSQVTAMQRELRATEREIADRDQRIALMEYFREIPTQAPAIVSRHKSAHPGGTATAVFLASDWHIEESVDPRAVGGHNEYSLDVAWKRARQFFDSVLWLLKAKRQEAQIDDVVVALLGDFITGLVPRQDLSMRREVGPAKAARIAKEMLTEGLERIAKEAGARRIVVPCIPGNHGRMTEKPPTSRAHQWNIEWFMLGELAQHFAKSKTFEFLVPEDFCVLLEVQGLCIRFHHGDAVRFAGGTGGLTIPLNKARWRWNSTPGERVDLDCLGHFHQAFDGGSFVVNGSLIGTSGYARRSFEYQAPEQIGFLVRPEAKGAPAGSRGKVDTFKVFVT